MARRNSADAEMFHADRQVFRGWCGIIREKKKRRAGGNQGGNEFSRAIDQVIFPVNDSIHVDQISKFHNSIWVEAGGNLEKGWPPCEFWEYVSGFETQEISTTGLA